MNRSTKSCLALKVASMLLSACIAVSALHAQSIGTQVRRHFVAAEKYQRAHNLEAAVNEYKAILKIQPGISEVYANLGLIYFAQEKFGKSLQAMIQAQKLDPHMRGVSLWLGIDYVKLNQSARAIPLLRSVVAADAANRQAEAWLGLALWNAGSTTAAIDQLSRANRMFHDDLNIGYALGESYRKAANQMIESVLADSAGTPLQNQIYGDIYRQQKMWPKAIAHYKLAIKQDSQWRGAHLGIGKVYLATGKLRQAQQEFENELAVDPKSATAHAFLAESDILQGKVLSGLRTLQNAIARSPEKASSALGVPSAPMILSEPLSQSEAHALHSVKGRLEQSLSSPARSLALAFVRLRLKSGGYEKDWTQFQKTVTKHARAANLEKRAVFAYDRGQYSQAKGYLQEWIRSHPRDLQAKYLLAKTYQRLSLVVLEGLMRSHPHSYRSHQLLAETYENRGDDEKALVEYAIVEKMNPDLPMIHLDIGEILWKDNHPNEALKELHQELKVDPDDAEADGEIGTIFVEQHEPVKAVPYLKRALRLEPSLRLVHKQLGTAYMIEGNYPKAEAELLKAVRHDPDGSAHYELALVYRAEGRRADAAKEFEAAKRIKEHRSGGTINAAKAGGAK